MKHFTFAPKSWFFMRKMVWLFWVLLGWEKSFGQKLSKADKAIEERIQSHVRYLASDLLEGRRAGSKGEQLAADYIKQQFREIGLIPQGEPPYLQAFTIEEGRRVDPSSFLSLNSHQLELEIDYFPMAGSPAVNVDGVPSIALHESGLPWILDVKDDLEANRQNTHFDLGSSIKQKAAEAKKKGAIALVIYNSSIIEDGLKFDAKSKSQSLAIPVVYVKKAVASKYFKDVTAEVEVKLKVVLADNKREANNVVGFLNNGASHTVIIGAHYDHLGYGEDHNSLYQGTDKQIHNGADDNASGTAALIELARGIKKMKLKRHNYLFVAFSGEELGLYGSKYFVEHPTVNLTNVSYMLNMDMVGRLNEGKIVTVGGYGTSPFWSELFASEKDKYLKTNFDSSGVGPSDHTSFYRKDIPVLFFFTGTHLDYHKPTDDAERINYDGETWLVKYITRLVEVADNNEKPVFSKTVEPQMGTVTLKVTLGIMPDYTFSGEGVRVDGISDGKTAFKAGIKTGDVLIQLGGFNFNSLHGYMEVLNKFNKGDSTFVVLMRGKNRVILPVTFQ